jgi:PAS domain S-box-containing protein
MTPPPPPDPAPPPDREAGEAILEALRRGEVDAVVSQSAVLLLRVHEAEAARAASEARLSLALDAARMGTWEWHLPSGRFVCSAALEALLGRAPGAFAGTAAAFLACVHPDDRDRFRGIPTGLGGEGSEETELRLVWPDGSLHWLALTGRPLAGEAATLAGVAMDVTARKRAEARLAASLREKEVLLREIHHRVKNNLQVVCSLLSLQRQGLEDPALQALFQESEDRIRAMALIHETLYQAPDVARFNLAPYLRALGDALLQSYGVDPSRVTLRTELDDLGLPLDTAVPLGLVLHELLSNALKHAFPDGRAGDLQVDLRAAPAGPVTLRVADTGVGLPADLDVHQTASLGWQLVCALAEQLGGAVAVDRAGGTTVTLTFPCPADAAG